MTVCNKCKHYKYEEWSIDDYSGCYDNYCYATYERIVHKDFNKITGKTDERVEVKGVVKCEDRNDGNCEYFSEGIPRNSFGGSGCCSIILLVGVLAFVIERAIF
jgi:hypothetical protein